MAQIKITLDTRRIKEDSTYPIVFTLSHNGESRFLKTGFYLHQTEWDGEKLAFKKNALNNKSFSTRLKEIELEYQAKIIDFIKDKKHFKVQELKEYLIAKTVTTRRNQDLFWAQSKRRGFGIPKLVNREINVSAYGNKLPRSCNAY